MQISRACDILTHILAYNRSAAAVVGQPGIGKTRLVRDLAKGLGLEYRPVEMAFYQTEDLTGLPYREGDRTRWTKPWWFPEDGEGVLALEDVNRVGDPNVLNCLMALLLDRRLHTHTLPSDWRVVATLNSGTQFLTARLDPAHISRLAVIEVETDLDSVLAWGQTHAAHPLVLEFLQANPSYLFQRPAADGQRPWANPRSWLQGAGENLPREGAQGCNPAFLQALIGTFVGEPAAVAFVNWFFTAPPSCKAILERPLGWHARFRFEADPALLMQRLVEFAEYLSKIGFRRNLWDNFTTFLALVPGDALAGFVRHMQRKQARLIWTQELTKWWRKTS